jgi:hypothetical protein
MNETQLSTLAKPFKRFAIFYSGQPSITPLKLS